MAVLAVAEQVEHHVSVEALPVFGRQGHRLGHRFGILAVHVEHRATKHPSDVSAVRGRARVFGIGGEPNLIVDDDVNRAAGFICREPAQVQRLGDHALAYECGVAMDQQRQHADPVLISFSILLGADAAFDHWVHELKMARVEGQGHVHVVAARRLAIERVAEVVLHIAGADVLLRVVILEPCEDLPHVHFHDVDHHVESPAVRHADDHFLYAQLGGALGEDVEHGNHALAALEREALGAGVLRMQKLLEDLGVCELGEDANLLLATQVDVVSGELHAVAEPIARLPVL